MKSKINKKNNQKGFTFIEIILASAIVIFLSATMFQIITVSDTQRGLILNAEKIKAGVRLAQAYSLSVPSDSTQRDVCGFGIHLSGSTAILYYLHNTDYRNNPNACGVSSNFDYSPSSPVAKVDEQIIELDSEYSVSGAEIFFQAPYGNVYDNTTKLNGNEERTITITNTEGRAEIITINGGGKINL